MRILSIDCAGSGCGVCLWVDGAVCAQSVETMARGQDARLMPLIEELMAKAAWAYADLDRIAVTRGPGSFTGLRIGLACARAIGLAAEKPVLGIDRFAVHAAQQASRAKELLVVLESRRLELYTRLYAPVGQPVGEAAMQTPDEIAALVQAHPALRIAGDAQAPLATLIASALFVPPTEPEAQTCASLAASADPADPGLTPRPLYLRAPDVTMKPCEAV